MTFDPYEILGIPRESDAAAIKRAYRRKAKTTHPDAGGDPREFDKVNTAYMVLSDPVRRERYDRDGVIDSGSPDNALTMAINVIVEFIMAVAQQHAVGNGGDPCSVDLMKQARGHFTTQISELRKQRKPIEKTAESLRKIEKRMTDKKKANPVLRKAILAQANSAAIPLRQIDEKIKAFENAIELVENYGFDVEKMDGKSVLQNYAFFTTDMGVT